TDAATGITADNLYIQDDGSHGFTLSQTNVVKVENLAFNSASGRLYLDQDTLDNDITNFAANGTRIVLNNNGNADGIVVASVNGIDGVTPGGNFDLYALGAITQTEAITAQALNLYGDMDASSFQLNGDNHISQLY